MNTMIFIITIVAPVGTVYPLGLTYTQETLRPIMKHTTAITAELTVTEKNDLHILMELTAGKIISAEISSAPMTFMPRTIVTAVRTAITVLYKSALSPVAFMKFSSKVTAKILL